jgi:crotonobetainyl-CoA:carnitine CoA-transferase CaiB-like acyl-CoA transferase
MAPDPTPAPGPLDGLLVLDLSRVLAGPYCTMTLGDFGARVIKIEEPGRGDDTRSWGPPFWDGESTYFLAINRNKESLTLDLKSTEGKDILWKLVACADVLVENFRPGTLERLGFGYEACAARNPRLVYASVSGYGQTGPDAARGGYDLIAQGEGGVMSVTGRPEDPPMKAGVSQADIVAGLWVLNGILAALVARDRTGKGQRVDASLLEGQIGLLAYYTTNFWATGEPPDRLGNQHPNLAPYGTYRCRDAWITVGAGNDSLFTKLCAALGSAALATRPEFATNSDRLLNRDALEVALGPLFATLDAEGALVRLREAGVPSGRVRAVPEVLKDPQALARDMVVPLPHGKIAGYKTTGIPVKLSATPGRPRSAPPLLGEHTNRILEELGYSTEEIAELRLMRVV